MIHTLVQPLFDGPIDIVGDVHGEFAPLNTLLHRMGYDAVGRHPEGRRLVFVGDLGDRGPDSPGVVEWICDRIGEGRAQAVMGNHDFNALHAAAGGGMKTELCWLFDEARPLQHHGHAVPQTHARGRRRDDILVFFAGLPIALERGGPVPVRVVHASWNTALVERIRHRRDALRTYHLERQAVAMAIDYGGGMDDLARTLMHQNGNAVKCLTSGVEGRFTTPRVVGDRPRYERRVPWWDRYDDAPLCVIGHYWRVALPEEDRFETLFPDLPLNALHGRGPVFCVDYSVGKRYRERLAPGFTGAYRTHLGALRLPERVLYFDDAEPMPLAVRPA